MPAARWGWHQLDDRWARRLVARADIAPAELVVDIGAGTGAITRHLLAAGAQVIAVEHHPRRAARLRRRFGDDVRVVEADAADLRLPRRPFRVVANPPFAITTALLRRILHDGSRLHQADLIVPTHVAARWGGGRGRGHHRWSTRFDVTITARVPRSAFRPPPPRPAAVLTFRRRL